MIGSHNTMTYLEPEKWWHKLLGFTAKCQSKNILEQYKNGARVFDIRVNLDCAYSHGIIDYIIYDFEVSKWLLPYYNKCPKALYRIILEKGDKEAFDKLIERWLPCLPQDKILYIVNDKQSWNIIWKNPNIQFKEINHHPEYPKDGLLPWPKLHNKKYSKLTDKQIKNKRTIYWVDFI